MSIARPKPTGRLSSSAAKWWTGLHVAQAEALQRRAVPPRFEEELVALNRLEARSRQHVGGRVSASSATVGRTALVSQ
jgi:hypothetical protein